MDISRFLFLQRQIFGICPKCNEFFRLSECKIYSKKKPPSDWKDELELEQEKIEIHEKKILQIEEELREKAREKGRRRAKLLVGQVDPVFAPRGLSPDDAKVIFHPIDYVVFNGMKSGKPMKNIVLLDRRTNNLEHRQIQKSIEEIVNHEKYEWQTIRVKNDGKIYIE